jgi:hypothetical protein
MASGMLGENLRKEKAFMGSRVNPSILLGTRGLVEWRQVPVDPKFIIAWVNVQK